MDTQVHSIHFTADRKLLDFVQEKTSKLELIFDQIIACEVYLRLDKNNEKETRRRMREAGPKPYTGQIADPEKAQKQIREMLESATTNWDEIREQSWEDD